VGILIVWCCWRCRGRSRGVDNLFSSWGR